MIVAISLPCWRWHSSLFMAIHDLRRWRRELKHIRELPERCPQEVRQ